MGLLNPAFRKLSIAPESKQAIRDFYADMFDEGELDAPGQHVGSAGATHQLGCRAAARLGLTPAARRAVTADAPLCVNAR